VLVEVLVEIVEEMESEGVAAMSGYKAPRAPQVRRPSGKTVRRDGLVRLKESVNVACDLFFAKRGIGNKWHWR
jgi:hypothetical protein